MKRVNYWMKRSGYIVSCVFVLVMCCCLFSCTEEMSENLKATDVIFQKYRVDFSNTQDTWVYARFVKDEDKAFNELKLTGEQQITVNDKSMNYHYVNDQAPVDYSYSLKLGKVDQVDFTFQRAKNKQYKNTALRSAVLPVSIPTDLAFIQNDVAWKWNGEDLKAGEKLEVTLETDKDGYAIYYGSISDDGREVTFSNVPKGDYVLILRRMVVSETQDNDLPAKGEMTICYYDKRKISVKESV